MKKLCVVGKKREPDLKLNDVIIDYVSSLKDINQKYDLIALWDCNEKPDTEFIQNNSIIRLHPSLLPSFNSTSPIKDAFMYGVKVTGITVHMVENEDMTGRILAQYPVLIDAYTHYDQLLEELEKLSAKIYPLVIKSVLTDKVFDIIEFLSDTSSHKCGGCSGKCGNCNN